MSSGRVFSRWLVLASGVRMAESGCGSSCLAGALLAVSAMSAPS